MIPKTVFHGYDVSGLHRGRYSDHITAKFMRDTLKLKKKPNKSEVGQRQGYPKLIMYNFGTNTGDECHKKCEFYACAMYKKEYT